MAKMWAGRTDGVTEQIADDFNSSIHFDSRMYRQDIQGSMTHAAMLAKQGIISQSDAETLIDGLAGILADLDNGDLAIDMTCEDIHMFVEQVLTQRLGDVGKRLHTARSRNDQVALDIRLYLRSEIDEISALVKSLIAAVTDKAEEYKAAIGKLKDAGYYVIGRITTFNDTYFAKDHPEFAITDEKLNKRGLKSAVFALFGLYKCLSVLFCIIYQPLLTAIISKVVLLLL